MIKLLPCPFCGGTAELEKMGWPHHVFCIECGAKTTSGKLAEEGEQEAIEKWNRRVKKDDCSMTAVDLFDQPFTREMEVNNA